MEPVTHFLTGACLGRTGFNRRTAYATLAMTLAAEAPDLDVFWGFRGPVAGFRASPRHYPHLSGRAVGRAGRDRCGLALASQPASSSPPFRHAGPCYGSCLCWRFSATSFSTGPTTTAFAHFSLQPALVRAGYRLHPRAGGLCRSAARPGPARDLRPGRPGDRRAQAVVSRTRLGDRRDGAGRDRPGGARGGASSGAALDQQRAIRQPAHAACRSRALSCESISLVRRGRDRRLLPDRIGQHPRRNGRHQRPGRRHLQAAGHPGGRRPRSAPG